MRFAEYLPGDEKGRHAFVCPDCGAIRGRTSFYGSLGPWHQLDGPVVFRQPQADRDGIEAWGHTKRSRENLLRRRQGRTPDELHEDGVPFFGGRNGLYLAAFDTWCLVCPARMRVDSRHAQR